MMIPPPTNKVKNVTELRREMQTTHCNISDFVRFKSSVRAISTNLNLNRGRISAPRRWGRLEKKMIVLEPSLIQYQDLWPIAHYHSLYIKNIKKHRKKNQETIELSSEDSCSPVRECPPKSTTALLRNPQQPLVLEAQVARSASTAASPSSSEYTVVALCYLCHSYTSVEVDSFLNHRLAKLINDAATLRRLRSSGICFDQHLDYLAHHLDNNSRAALFKLIPLDQVDAMQLGTALRLNKSLAQTISPPPKAAQEQIVDSKNHKKFGDWLQHAMSLQDKCDLFEDLLVQDVMEKFSVRLFLIELPVIEHLRATIRQIVKERPTHFRQYTDYWPIRLYLNHRKRLLGCTSPQYNAEQEEYAFTQVFEEQRHDRRPAAPMRRTGIISIEQVPCRHHSPIDISGVPVTFRMFLQRLGIAELLPVLVCLGLRTDSDIDKFCKLSLEERTEVMEIAKLKLYTLQHFMLDTMCKRWQNHFHKRGI